MKTKLNMISGEGVESTRELGGPIRGTGPTMQKYIATGLLIMAAGVAAISQTNPATMSELELEHQLTFEFSTPHTDWAQPYARGKTRVLFFTSPQNAVARECVELMQRFDIEAEAVFWISGRDENKKRTYQWHGGKEGEQRMLKLLEQKWDCFVLFDMPLARMSAEAQYKLIKQVDDGAGLVLGGGGDDRVLKAKNRQQELPAFLHVSNIEAAYTAGKGRAVLLMTKRPIIDYHEGWQADYDHWQQQYGRAVLWAAGKEPQTQLAITFSGESNRTVLATLAGTPVGNDLKAEVTIRRGDEIHARFADTPIRAGQTLTFPQPHLPAGNYYADARVMGTNGVETWAAEELCVVSSRMVTKVELKQTWGELGDKIEGQAVIGGEPMADEKVRIRLLDRRRRELARQDVAIRRNSAPFRFAIEPWMPMLVTVEAALSSSAKEMSSAYAYFNVTKRHQGRFNFVIWDGPVGTLSGYGQQSLAEHGVTVELSYQLPPKAAAAHETAWVPYTTRITPHLTPNDSLNSAPHLMKFCWNDDKAVKKDIEELVKRFTPAREHGVFAWSLGDETTTQDACLSEHCARAYRKYLKEIYGSIKALNASWATKFTDWNQVGLSPVGDNLKFEDYLAYLKNTYTIMNFKYMHFTGWRKWEDVKMSKWFYESEEVDAWRKKNYPRWYDRMEFKSWNFVELCKRYGMAYKAIDPLARTGVEGVGRFEDGSDVDLIVRNTGFWGTYPDTLDELIRSIAPRDYLRSNWMGYSKDANSLLGRYYRMVTSGMDSVWFWRWDGIESFHGWLAPDLRPFPAVKEILKDTQIIRDGLGDLLINSEMQDDRIAILYSHPSVYAHRLENGLTNYGGYESAHVAVHNLVRKQGLQFRYVTDRMLRLGEFDASKYDVLLLPRADAIGDAEAEVIKDFARNGGTVVADVRPGKFNGHCGIREAGVLDELFGVAKSGLGEGKTATATIDGLAPFQTIVNAAVTLAGGKPAGAAGEAPIGITHTVGKGRAILLNFPFANHPELNLKAGETVKGELAIKEILRPAMGNLPLTLRDAQGQYPRGMDVIRWNNGGIKIVAIFNRTGRDTAVHAVLKQPGPVYDLRQRKDLGCLDSIDTTVPRSRASFFVLYPKAAAPATLSVARAEVAPGTVVKCKVSVPDAQGLHAFRIRVYAGDVRQEWHDQIVLAGRRAVAFNLPIAFNDSAGHYRIEAIDVFTDKAATAAINVK